MCLYPRLVQNPKYKSNKKNGGNIPPVSDCRITLVPIGCGECKECRKQRARQWKVRLAEDIKTNTNGKFVTLTFSNDNYTKYHNEINKTLKGYDIDNAIATKAVRHFLERWRKQYKKSLRHWLITELGQTNTEHLHLHGIVWTDESMETIEKIWKNGFMWKTKKQNYVNSKTVNYISKYITKIDFKHKTYKPIILLSPGIGKNYVNTYNASNNKFKAGETNETYRTHQGTKTALPIYYRNKIYSEEEREKLWIEKLDKNIRYINGIKFDIRTEEKEYMLALIQAQKESEELGYGNGEKDWEQEIYERERRKLKQQERTEAKTRNASGGDFQKDLDYIGRSNTRNKTERSRN